MWYLFLHSYQIDENNARVNIRTTLFNKNDCPPIEETQKAPFVTLVSALK